MRMDLVTGNWIVCPLHKYDLMITIFRRVRNIANSDY